MRSPRRRQIAASSFSRRISRAVSGVMIRLDHVSFARSLASISTAVPAVNQHKQEHDRRCDESQEQVEVEAGRVDRDVWPGVFHEEPENEVQLGLTGRGADSGVTVMPELDQGTTREKEGKIAQCGRSMRSRCSKPKIFPSTPPRLVYISRQRIGLSLTGGRGRKRHAGRTIGRENGPPSPPAFARNDAAKANDRGQQENQAAGQLQATHPADSVIKRATGDTSAHE